MKIFLKRIVFILFGLAHISVYANITNTCLMNIELYENHHHTRSGDFCNLNLSNCDIKDEHITQIVKHLKSSHIQELILANNQLTAIGVTQLVDTLPKNIFYLTLDKNNIGFGIIALAKNTTLSGLSLNDNHLGDEAISILSANDTLKYLHLRNNDITNKGLAALAKNSHISFLDIANNAFTAQGLKHFNGNTTLYTMDVSNNSLTAEAASALVNIPNLFNIIANNNNLEDKGAYYFSKKQTSIGGDSLYLELKNNHIKDAGAIALAQMKIYSANGYILILDNNEIGPEGAQALSQNKQLHWLQIGNNKIKDEGAIALGESSISRLEIDANELTDNIVPTFEENCHINYLNVSNNHLTINGIERLKDSCKGRVVLGEGNA